MIYTSTTPSVKRIVLKHIDKPVSLPKHYRETVHLLECLLDAVVCAGAYNWDGISRTPAFGGKLPCWSRDTHHEDTLHSN